MEEKDAPNQASSLEKLISEVQQGEKDEYTEADLRVGSDQEIKVDILALPPRSEVHQTNKRTHVRLSKPLKRLLFILILIIFVIGGSIYFFGQELLELLQ
ncbi:MAG TPA: hypothetical protein VK144_08625 [Bacillota bacterium]|nr:hypothetical protein [Bacillota bacterium]